MKRINLTQESLEELCVYWQRVLRLQDWEIRVVLASPRDLNHFDVTGWSDCLSTRRRAIIRVLDAGQHGSDNWWDMFEVDQEVTLVHELLHVHFSPFEADADTPADTAQEQAINAIAVALVRLKRETPAL